MPSQRKRLASRAAAYVGQTDSVAYVLPLRLRKQRSNSDRDICAHKQREGEGIEYLFRRGCVYMPPFGGGGYRAEDEEGQAHVAERLRYRTEEHGDILPANGADDAEGEIYGDADGGKDERGHYRH